MSDNVVFINQIRENILDFDITIQGLEQKEMFVYFIIQTGQMTVGFKAEKTGIGDKWSVRIPPLPFLERTTYQFYMCVIADGYHFEPLQGTATITGSHDVYITKPENTTLKSTIPPDVPAEIRNTFSGVSPPIPPANVMIAIPATESELPKKKGRERSIEQIARDLTNEVKTSTKKSIILNESASPKANGGGSRDKDVKRILQEIKIGDKNSVVTMIATKPTFKREKVVVR